MPLRTLQKQIRRRLSSVPHGRLLSVSEFRKAAQCERMRIYRNNSVLTVLLVDIVTTLNDAHDPILCVCESLDKRLEEIDSYGFTYDGRIGVLLPDYCADNVHELVGELIIECRQSGCRISVEVIQFPEDSMDDLLESDTGSGRRSSNSVRRGEAATFFSAPTPTWKRMMDVVGSALGLTLLSPFILLGVILVKATSKGTAFFQQERTGQAGETFTINKIRTMQMNADSLIDEMRHLSDRDGPAFKIKNDPRTFTVGRFLRKLSIDELPQLWNVLVGDMSLVGPRPLPTSESAELTLWQRERLDVKPGITGPWQVSGRDEISFEEWMQMDIDYARNMSVLRDLKILLLTFPAVIMCRGAS